VPQIIEYECVLRRLMIEGLQCNYPFGGSFGWPKSMKTEARGWIGPPDSTINVGPEVQIRSVGEPVVDRLTRMTVQAWTTIFPGEVWVMPSSHWSFELDHGSKDWLPGLLTGIGIDPSLLVARTNGAAIEFVPEEREPFATLVRGLLNGLSGSDFTLAFPGREVISLIHHHKQLWWVSTSLQLIGQLDNIDIP